MTKDEWKTAYAAHMAQRLDIELAQAQDLADAGVEGEEELSGPEVADWRTPEESVDDELSYWGD